MNEGGSAEGLGNAHLLQCDEGTGQGGAEPVIAFVGRGQTDGQRKDRVEHGGLGVADNGGFGAVSQGLLAEGFHVFLLADIDEDGVNFIAALAEPDHDGGGVEAAGIRKYTLLVIAHSYLQTTVPGAAGRQPGFGASW